MRKVDFQDSIRLNPFVVPTESRALFLMLVLTALSFILFIGIAIGLIYIVVFDLSTLDSVPSAGQSQLGGLLIDLIAAPAIAVAIFVIPVILVYRTSPNRIRRRRRWQPFEAERDPRLAQELDDLTAIAEVAPPAIELSEGLSFSRLDGEAFGFPPNYVLGLDGARRGMRKQPFQFRTVVLHELAHIKNGDIRRTQLVEALWGVLPFVVTILFMVLVWLSALFVDRIVSDQLAIPPDALGGIIYLLLAQPFLIFAVFLVLRGSLLRMREVFADWRVVLWGYEAPLRDLLEAKSRQTKTRWWELHPTPQDRLKALDKPYSLFGISIKFCALLGLLFGLLMITARVISVWLAFTSLSVVSLSVSELARAVARLGGDANTMIPISYVIIEVPLVIAMLVAIYVVAGSVVVEIERDAFAELVTGRRRPGRYLWLFLPALVVVLGFELGPALLSILTLFIAPPPNFLWPFEFLLALWLAFAYSRFLAIRLLRRQVDTGGIARASRRTRIAFGALIAIPIGILMTQRYYILPLPVDFTGTVLFFAPPFYGVVFALTWLVFRLKRRQVQCCHVCGAPILDGIVLGRECQHCGEQLAPWAYTPPVPQVHEDHLGLTSNMTPISSETQTIPSLPGDQNVTKTLNKPNQYEYQVRAFARFGARIIDLALFNFIVVQVLFILFPISPALQRMENTLQHLVVLFLWVFVEALLLRVFGTTPGKKLLRLKLIQDSGVGFGYRAALRRSFGVYAKGLGLGLPILELLSLGRSHVQFVEDRITPWDYACRTKVVPNKIGAIRSLVATAIILTLGLWLLLRIFIPI